MLDDLADVFTIVGGISAAVVGLSAVIAFLQYRDSVRTQRAQWLLSLFERFYERDLYREARRVGYAVEDKQKWYDYLNFFEFIVYLQKEGQLTQEDVAAMFDYWLKQLDVPEILEDLAEKGFENLSAYFSAVGQKA